MRIPLILAIGFWFATSVNATPLFELRVGASWTYEVDVKGGTSYTLVNHIDDKHIVDGTVWYRLVEFDEIFWITNTSQGQMEALSSMTSEMPPSSGVEMQLIFKFPAEPGEQWTTVDGDVITYRGKHRTTVPAGSFSCHIYFIDMEEEGYSEFCIAEGIGVIYNIFELKGYPKEVAKLVDYQ
ncbi:MAG: hypothetical protein ACK4L8_06950 [Nitrincola lacisaponensis]|uniref:hypothetical protein n=1 Tax=Nitrincola lacisaponensis TaxID=267850 RepID=UPI00391A7CB9